MKRIEIPPEFDAQYFRVLDRRLRDYFGTPEMKKCPDPTGALVKGILSQNTNDRNRDRAYDALVKKFPRWVDVLTAPDSEIASAIRPAGMANQRTARIKRVLGWLAERNGGKPDASFLLKLPPEKALEELTSIDGIGLKTAAVFLLFCGGVPIFPVDTHIKRIMPRLGVFPKNTSAEKMIIALSEVVPPEIHGTLHLNLLALGRNICTARKAMCEKCPVADLCDKRI